MARCMYRSGLFAVRVVAVLFVTLAFGTAMAQVPTSLTQQGRLLDDQGEPISGQVEMTFTIYDAETNGAVVWQGSQTVTVEEGGFYSATLGSDSNPSDGAVLAGGQTWLTVSIDGGAEMSPRIRLRSVPYAAVAGRADAVSDGAINQAALASDLALDDSHLSSLGWNKLDDVPAGLSDGDDDTLGGMTCSAGELAEFDGTNWACVSGGFATSDQSCPTDQVAIGIDTSGALICDAQNSYDGSDFAISDQACSGAQVVTGVAADGTVTCAAASCNVTDNGDGTQTISCADGTSVRVSDAEPQVSASASCLAHLNANPSAGDGVYWIDPDGAGGNRPFRAYCDMSTGPGGWTLIAVISDQDGTQWHSWHPNWKTPGSFGTPTDPATTSDAKSLAYATVDAQDIMLTFNDQFLTRTGSNCFNDRTFAEYLSSLRWSNGSPNACATATSTNGSAIGETALSEGGTITELRFHWGEAHDQNTTNSDQTMISSDRRNSVSTLGGVGARYSACGHTCCNCRYFDVSGDSDTGDIPGGTNVYGIYVR